MIRSVLACETEELDRRQGTRRQSDKVPRYRMGPATRWALLFALLCFLWGTFKVYEPVYFPVVKDFSINHVVDQTSNNTVLIYGSFNKVRSCEFKEVVGYADDVLVQVIFVLPKDAKPVTRLKRPQSYGPWQLDPKTPKIELFVTHECWTGTVVTPLFKGALVL